MAVLKHFPGAVVTSGRECARRRNLKKPFLVKTCFLGSRFANRENVIKNCGLSSDDQAVDYKFGSTKDRLLNEGAM